jgi:hypothetical protein
MTPSRQTPARGTAALNSVNRKQINLAGPRYSPGIDKNAPNIQIDPLLVRLGALAHDSRFAAHVEALRTDLVRATEYSTTTLSKLFRRRTRTPNKLVEVLAELSRSNPGNVSTQMREVRLVAASVRDALDRKRDELFTMMRDAEKEEVRRRYETVFADVQRARSAVHEIEAFLQSDIARLTSTNCMVLLGAWGTGKTHFLCDVTRERMANRLPTLLVLGQHLPTGVAPLQGVCDLTGVAPEPRALLGLLQRLGKSLQQRALLIVDAINEGDMVAWRNAMGPIADEAAELSNLAVVLSCRRPFDTQILSRRASAKWIAVEHQGFADVEFDAQLEYFKFYRIPAPQTPLLTPEFSRPLFLKIFCETICDLSRSSQRRYFRDLASGQKGMTKALEDFAKHIGGKIERDLMLPPLTCWRIIKGDMVNGELTGIAPTLARELRDYVTRREAIALVRALTGLNLSRSKVLLQRLLADGLLMQGVRWSATQETDEVVQLPYQRFSDHIIARHLLDQHLNVSSESTVRRSFYANRPLGKVFSLRGGGHYFAMPGIAGAIMIEFPERVKRTLPADDRELAFLLPRARMRPTPLKEIFLEGLYWRARESFNGRTTDLVNFFLSQSGHSRNATLEVLIGLATRPGHPYSALRLKNYLAAMPMGERDAIWSEFLRDAGDQSIVAKLIQWVERTNADPMDETSAGIHITLMSLMLTTTRRELRDRLTRALFHIGRRFPRLLFNAAIEYLTFNDPYVSERLLAAAHGLAVTGWADPDQRELRASLSDMARRLHNLMFAPNAPHATKHVLRRDSALGIIEYARLNDPTCISQSELAHLRRPLRSIASPFPEASAIADAAVEPYKSVLKMDFENYTLGRLVKDRNNYDYDNSEYKAIRKQVLWRIADLGYDPEKFGAIDNHLHQMSWRMRDGDAGKIDRYGKKYSWIAYFEMYGVQSDTGRLKEWRRGERSSDIDIDPSFPEEPLSWKPVLDRVYRNAPTDPREWIEKGPTPNHRRLFVRSQVDGIRGPWVLLDGFIQQPGPGEGDIRRIFTFLRGVLVTTHVASRIRTLIGSIEYPGNSRIPEGIEEHYTFAGEIPRSYRYASDARRRDGRANPDRARAFTEIQTGTARGVLVEVPVRRFGWESYHGPLNTVSGVTVLSAAIAEELDLVNRGRGWDLFDRSGRHATIYRTFREGDDYFRSHFLYIRRGLLHRYLRKTGQVLLMIPWGERNFHHSAFQLLHALNESGTSHYAHIHKQAEIIAA